MVLIAALLLSRIAPSSVQSWEKRVAPGVVLRMDWDPVAPRTMWALRVSLNSPTYRAMTQLGGRTVYEDNASKGRATVTEMVQGDRAIGGINGDFFPFTGHPLNLMVREGELLSFPFFSKAAPEAHRATFGWGPGYSAVGFGAITSTIEAGMGVIKVEGWDEEAEPDQVTLNTPAVGIAEAKAPNVYAVIRTRDAKWGPDSTVKGEVTEVGTDVIMRPVSPDTAVVVAAGTGREKLLGLREGETVTVHTHVEGFDWSKVTNVIGGGPTLVKNGQVFVDWAEGRFREDFAKNRHPRTAIGRTEKGDLWLVAVDGRSKISVGATLDEMAGIMKRLGCVDAINLDGGGSTTFNLFGLTLNRPSDGAERPVANGVLVLGPTPAASNENLALPTFDHALGPKDHLTLRVGFAGDSRRFVRNADVIWNATGSAWIDQGGTLHLRGAGTIEVSAFVHGRLLKATYAATGAELDKPNGFSAQD
jgi:hypothetical protein